MPVLEDGLSSGHASDTDNNNPTVMLMKRQITEIEREINQGIKAKENGLSPNSEERNSSSSPLDVINGCLSGYDDARVHSQLDSMGKYVVDKYVYCPCEVFKKCLVWWIQLLD